MKKYLLLACVAIAMLAVGCSKDDNKPSFRLQKNSVELFRESEERIIVENAAGAISYRSQNPDIATVSSDGVVTGWVRGETNIEVHSGDESALFHVMVGTRINTIPEPILEFGKSKDYIKSKIPKEAYKQSEREDMIAFMLKSNGAEILYFYIFKEGLLKSCAFNVRMDVWEDLSLVDYLYERYIYDGKTNDGDYLFFTPDRRIFVGTGTMVSSSVITVLYTPR